MVQEGGARIFSAHHRPPPSVISSTTSSSASVATNGGSTTALIHHSKKSKKNYKSRIIQIHNLQKHNIYNKTTKMTTGVQKELNLLLTTPHVPDISDDSDVCKSKSSGDETIPYIETDVEAGEKRLSNGMHKDGSDESRQGQTTLNVGVATDGTPAKKLTLTDLVPQVLAAISVSLGSMVVGYAQGYTSPALVSMNATDSTLRVTLQEASWIGSLMPLAALIGGMAGGPLIETIGRRATILATAVPFILSFLLIAFAVNVPMVLAGRSISGFCVGIASLALPVYLGETIQPEVRGTLGLVPTTFGNFGILLSFVAGTFLDWSMMALFGACIPVPFLVCMFLIPETPRWFISKNKNKQARSALQWLRGKHSDVSHEFSEIEKLNSDSEKDDSSNRVTELFQRRYRKPLLISIGLMFFQQLSGINAVIFYTVNIFQAAGSTIDENLSTIVVGIVNLLSTFIATVLIDRLGRKILLYISSVSMTTTLFILATFFYFKMMGYNVEPFGFLPLLSFAVYIVGFSIGFGPVPWLMMGEILPAKIRGSAASLVTAFNWSCTFVVTKTFVDFSNLMGFHGTFWAFSCITFASLFFVIFFVPETQGKSLEDIERNLTGTGPPVPVRAVRRMSSIANLKPMPISL